MTARTVLSVAVLILATALVGCSRQAIRCDGKLTPINVPAPDTAPAQPAEDSAR